MFLALFILESCNYIALSQNATKSGESAKTIVTLYFCGTGMTKDWWKSELACSPNKLSGFWVPELIATLYHEQIVDSNSKDQCFSYIIDGVGAGLKLPLVDILAQGFPSNPKNPRGWELCMKEARTYLQDALEKSKGVVTLNLVGFSRGAVLAMRMASEAYRNDKIVSINLLCFDPVAGDPKKELIDIYLLNEKVKNYIGIYAEDERSGLFDPRIPDFSSSQTKVWMMTVPGGHETMVGNNQKDGHSVDFHSYDLMVFKEEWVDELARISWITSVMAIELLGSKEWGNNQFNRTWSKDSLEFITQYDSMYFYENYEYIRTISFLPFDIAAYWPDKIRGEGCHWCNIYDMFPTKRYNNSRCAKKLSNGEYLIEVDLQNEIEKQTGAKAWEKLNFFMNSK